MHFPYLPCTLIRPPPLMCTDVLYMNGVFNRDRSRTGIHCPPQIFLLPCTLLTCVVPQAIYPNKCMSGKNFDTFAARGCRT